MEVSTFNVDRDEAVKMLRKYREHRAYSTPVDSDIVRITDVERAVMDMHKPVARR